MSGPTEFEKMLRFVYTDRVQLTDEDDAIGVFYVAHKYDIGLLLDECVRYLTAETVYRILEVGVLFNNSKLITDCLQFIAEKNGEVVFSEDFLKLEEDTLRMILELDLVQISEVYLFMAVISWANTACWEQNLKDTDTNKRIVLGKCVRLIRFPAMSPDEFRLCQEMAPDFLSTNETNAILRKQFEGYDFRTTPRSKMPVEHCFFNERNLRDSDAFNLDRSHTENGSYFVPEMNLSKISTDQETIPCMDVGVSIFKNRIKKSQKCQSIRLYVNAPRLLKQPLDYLHKKEAVLYFDQTKKKHRKR